MMPGRDDQGIADPPPADRAHARHDARRGKRGEARIPPAVAVLVAVALYAVLPEPLLIGPRFLIPGLELALLVALIATNPLRMTRQTRWSRRASLALAILVVTSNLATLTLLVVDLVSDQDTPATRNHDTSCRSPTSGSPRTKPRTPSSKSPPGPARRRTGSPPSWTT